jgi:hypothetical protein
MACPYHALEPGVHGVYLYDAFLRSHKQTFLDDRKAGMLAQLSNIIIFLIHNTSVSGTTGDLTHHIVASPLLPPTLTKEQKYSSKKKKKKKILIMRLRCTTFA